MVALSYIPFCPCEGRQVSLWYLSAVCSATRWSKGSLGFREDREVIMNLVTQLSMRV